MPITNGNEPTYQEKNQNRPDFFDNEAQEEAKKWSGIKTAQVRRFFGQVKTDQRRFDLRKDTENAPDDSEACVAMALLKASTAYAAARDRKRQSLADFVADHAVQIKTIGDFTLFSRHFETVVAWHKVFNPKN